VLTLKKIARLPSKDRQEVMKVLRNSKEMKVLKQKIRHRRRQREKVTRSLEVPSESSNNVSVSTASMNNDWQNWCLGMCGGLVV
jgi:predicted aminopeptidase